MAADAQRQRLRRRAARLRPVPRQPRRRAAARRPVGRARAAPRALRPPDRLLVRLAAARHGRRTTPPPTGKLDAAGTLSAAGLAAAVATAVTGVADWTVSDGEDRRVGLFHGLLNGAATALQGASLAARLSGHRGSARSARHGQHGRHRRPRASSAGTSCRAAAAMVNRVATQHRAHALGARPSPTTTCPTASPTGVDVEGRKVLLYRDGDDRSTRSTTCAATRAPCCSRGAGGRLRGHLPAARVAVRRARRPHRARSRPPPAARRCRRGSATAGSRSAAPSPGAGAREPEEERHGMGSGRGHRPARRGRHDGRPARRRADLRRPALRGRGGRRATTPAPTSSSRSTRATCRTTTRSSARPTTPASTCTRASRSASRR